MRRRPENETSRRKVKSFRKIREKMSHFRKHRNGEVMKESKIWTQGTETDVGWGQVVLVRDCQLKTINHM